MTFEQGVDTHQCRRQLETPNGVIAYPTDTVYALGADIFHPDAVAKIYALKGREQHKPLLVNVAGKAQILPYLASLDPLEQTMMEAFWPGTLTIILQVNDRVPDYITRGSRTLGVRVPNHPLALDLLRQSPHPLISTSVNYSGEPPLLDDASIRRSFAHVINYLLGVDIQCPGLPSTIVRVDSGRIRILRPGGCDESLRTRFGPLLEA